MSVRKYSVCVRHNEVPNKHTDDDEPTILSQLKSVKHVATKLPNTNSYVVIVTIFLNNADHLCTEQHMPTDTR